MKLFAPYFFTLLYLAAMIRPIAPVIEFVIEQDYIAEFLCINKDRPELQCKGKCYLMQMLQEQQDQKKQELPNIDLREYPIGFVQIHKLNSKEILEIDSSTIGYGQNLYTYCYIYEDFHPPAFFV